jgi:hypothetical protein
MYRYVFFNYKHWKEIPPIGYGKSTVLLWNRERKAEKEYLIPILFLDICLENR